MAVIRKIVVNNTTVYPRSVTDAIVDTETGEKLSEVIPRMRRIINVVPTDPITNQEIDNKISGIGNSLFTDNKPKLKSLKSWQNI